jgi:Protein of unknown function (DUF2510)
MSSQSPRPAAPGWYPDPDHPDLHQRYWDGVAWTDQRAPLALWIVAGILGSND